MDTMHTNPADDVKGPADAHGAAGPLDAPTTPDLTEDAPITDEERCAVLDTLLPREGPHVPFVVGGVGNARGYDATQYLPPRLALNALCRQRREIAALKAAAPSAFALAMDAETERARKKFAGNKGMALAFLEEVGELLRELFHPYEGKVDPAKVFAEAVQVACTARRLAEEGNELFFKFFAKQDDAALMEGTTFLVAMRMGVTAKRLLDAGATPASAQAITQTLSQTIAILGDALRTYANEALWSVEKLTARVVELEAHADPDPIPFAPALDETTEPRVADVAPSFAQLPDDTQGPDEGGVV